MKIIVTGGAGFIGSAVCRLLVGATGHSVVNVDKLTYAANLASLEPIAANPALPLRPRRHLRPRGDGRAASPRSSRDAVMHLAAESHVDRSITGSDAFIQTNVVGTYTLLEAARAYWSALAARRARPPSASCTSRPTRSTARSAPKACSARTRPTIPPRPIRPARPRPTISRSPGTAPTGCPSSISNCSNNYGPYHFPEKLIPLMILNALEGKPLPVYGDGSNVRDWLYVEDHARALLAVVERGRPGETYNVGGRAERTNLDVVERICDVLDDSPPAAPGRRVAS